VASFPWVRKVNRLVSRVAWPLYSYLQPIGYPARNGSHYFNQWNYGRKHPISRRPFPPASSDPCSIVWGVLHKNSILPALRAFEQGRRIRPLAAQSWVDVAMSTTVSGPHLITSSVHPHISLFPSGWPSWVGRARCTRCTSWTVYHAREPYGPTSLLIIDTLDEHLVA
jgi:hypothetical protein